MGAQVSFFNIYIYIFWQNPGIKRPCGSLVYPLGKAACARSTTCECDNGRLMIMK